MSDFAKALKPTNHIEIRDSEVIGVIARDSDAKLPHFGSAEAAGADLHSVEHHVFGPGKRVLVDTGISLDIPAGYEVQIRPRSGLAWKHGVTVLNAPGTIDSDYSGPLKVMLINHGDEPFEVNVGDRIAQMVVAKVERLPMGWRAEFSRETERGEKGFGSTGVGAKS